jgi:hypothetical protein
MIDAISLETAHLLGDALPSAHRLRHRIFIGADSGGSRPGIRNDLAR